MLLAIGFLKLNEFSTYSPYFDGYRAGERREWVLIHADVPAELSAEQVLEAAFVATNAPADVIAATPGAQAILDALAEKHDTRARAISIGDVVKIARVGLYSCEKRGWERRITEAELAGNCAAVAA